MRLLCAFIFSFLVALLVACGPAEAPSPMGSVTSKMTSAGEVTAAVVSTKVPAPDYDFDTRLIKVEILANHTVDTVSGALLLLQHSVPAQRYVVVEGQVGKTIADIQTAFNMGQPRMLSEMSIPAAELISKGALTPAARAVIFQNLGEGSIAAYQVLTIAFREPQLRMIQKE